MGDWEDFCHSRGMDPSSPRDYDRFIDGLDEHGSGRRYEAYNAYGQVVWRVETPDGGMLSEAPGDFSDPDPEYLAAMKHYADDGCSRCDGSGRLVQFNMHKGGRCLLCLPDDRWNQLLGEVLESYRGEGSSLHGMILFYELRRVDFIGRKGSGFGVFRKGLPPTDPVTLFKTAEMALEYGLTRYPRYDHRRQ